MTDLLGTPVTLRTVKKPELTFVLDLDSNPHPVMRNEALLARRSAFDGPTAFTYWLGYRRCMAAATGCPEAEIDAWLDRHQ